MNHKFSLALVALSLGAFGATAIAQTKWDLPTAYPPANYHTENIVQFAKDVDAATGGKLKMALVQIAGAALSTASERTSSPREINGSQARSVCS